jgi:hypothetical protein
MVAQPPPAPAHLGGAQALTTAPVVGTPAQQKPDLYDPETPCDRHSLRTPGAAAVAGIPDPVTRG